jgi:hypothetical protein
MFILKEARRAMLAAYRSALAEGASHEVAIDTAVARYRAFVPEATNMEVRALLADVICGDAQSVRAKAPQLVH